MPGLSIAVDAPRHGGLDELLHYACATAPPAGTLVRVPLGARIVSGIVWGAGAPVEDRADYTVRTVDAVLDAMPPLNEAWRELVAFCARYYQRQLGEVALSVLPPELRRATPQQLARRVAKLQKAMPAEASATPSSPADVQTASQSSATALQTGTPRLTPQQAAALAAYDVGATSDPPRCVLLHGSTGSGKTEVYLHAADRVLNAGRQVLMLVPEINLTPQLEARVAARFPQRRVVSLHSALTPVERVSNWLAAHLGQADLVLGTRLAVFCPLPRLGLVVVDEEHDPSYKQQDGARHSARDLAVYRGHLERVPVLLGSATPSLESWLNAQNGHYQHIAMPARIGDAPLPTVRIVDMRSLPKPPAGEAPPALAPELLQALQDRLARGEQSLLFLNRRGYAPVLHCTACGWKSECAHCSAWRVFHKADRTLRCHHCGDWQRVPRACPECGNLDISEIGRGTEKLEEQVAQLLPGARVARIDADTTRRKGTLVEQLAAVHAGEVDVLVGTQMVTKGHDFRRVTLVAAVNPDGALYSADFRAPERLFAQLMQAAGRAGRDAELETRSEMWVQTWNPGHPMYAALTRHDYPAFAASQLHERRDATLPPYSHLALLRAEARDGAAADAFLYAARDAAAELPEAAGVVFYGSVPTHVARVAGFERRQMLIESTSRATLQRLLARWTLLLPAVRATQRGIARWAVDVDPLAI